MTYLDPYTPWIIQQFQQLLLLPTIVYFAIALTVFVVGLGVYLTSTDFSLEDILSLLPSTIVSVRKSINKRKISAVFFVMLGLTGIFTFADQLQVEGSQAGGGGPSVYQCFLPLTLLCGTHNLNNSTNFCTSTNIGTSSCSLPQNGCDGVLRGYGRCEEGTNSVTIAANTLFGSQIVVFPTAFTNLPAVGDISVWNAGTLTSTTQYFTTTLFNGGRTFLSVPQNVWTEVFGSLDPSCSAANCWEIQGVNRADTVSTIALNVGCNCTGFETGSIEWSSNQAVPWHNILNFTLNAGSSVSTAVSPPAGSLGNSWFRVTINNQSGVSESLFFSNLSIIFAQTISRVPSFLQGNPAPSRTQFTCAAQIFVRLSSSTTYTCAWKAYVNAG